MKIRKYKKQIKNILLTKLLKGNNVQCNICQKKFTTFIPYLNRINACCPNCGSLERTRLLKHFIDVSDLVNKETRLLHVAPEKYLYKIFDSNPQIEYYPIDKFTEGYSYPAKTVEMDITSLSFKDKKFNGIICMHVLEHVVDDKKGLDELYRVLEPNGWAIIQVPFDSNRTITYEDSSIELPEERRKHFGQSDHVRIYGTDYIDRFKSAGFEVENWGFENNIPVELKHKYVFKEENIFLLRKR